MPEVSVIVPFYKVAPFMRRCAEALMAQTLSDVEFLFVDDASPDESRRILEDILAAHPDRNARILTHPVNRGLPAARNTGLAAATGKYVCHLDSDDYPEPDMLEKLYRAAELAGADIAYSDFYLSFENGERYMANPDFTRAEDLLKEGFLSGRCKYNVWNKLILRDLYTRSGILFPEGHAMGEDMTMIRLCLHAGTCIHVPEALYHYVKLNAGAMSNTLTPRQQEDIRFNAAETIAALESAGLPAIGRFIDFFKLSLKLPLLFSGDAALMRQWSAWWPEADRSIADNQYLPSRTRRVMLWASRGRFCRVRAYVRMVGLFYRIGFRKR